MNKHNITRTLFCAFDSYMLAKKLHIVNRNLYELNKVLNRISRKYL